MSSKLHRSPLAQTIQPGLGENYTIIMTTQLAGLDCHHAINSQYRVQSFYGHTHAASH